MKRILISMAVLTICLFLVSACGNGEKAEDKPLPVTKESLMHHRYELVSVNGEAVTWERVPEISFGEGFRVFGRVCNQFFGEGELKDGKLFVSKMGSTKMLCPDEKLDGLETGLSQMLMEGVEISLNGNELVLKRGDMILTYALRDKVN